MSLLGDFAGSFLQIAGQQGMQREEEDRQLRLREALDARRRKINRQERNEDYVTEQNLGAKPYVGYDAQGKPGLLQDEFAMGEAGPSRNTRRLRDAPRTPTGEVERKVGDELVRYRQFSDGTEEVIAKAPRYKPDAERGSSRAAVGDDGLTAYQREQLKRTDAREARLGKQSGKGGERPDNIRKAWDDEAARTAALEGEALRSKAAQYGMDQRGLPTDDKTLRSALMAQIDAQYGKRLESASKRGGDKPGSSAENPAPASNFSGDPPSGTWVRLPSGKVIQVP